MYVRYLTNTNNIKEVLLFPAMRPEDVQEGSPNTHASFNSGSLDLTTAAGLEAIEARLHVQPYILGNHPTAADDHIYKIVTNAVNVANTANASERLVGGLSSACL